MTQPDNPMRYAAIITIVTTCLLAVNAAPAAETDKREADETAVKIQAMEVLPRLYRVAGSGGDVGDVYLVKSEKPVLIDCGSRRGWDQLVGNLRLLGMTPADVRWVIGTHGHWDHVDAMTLIQTQYPQVKFAIHAGDAQFVINDDRVFSCAEPLYRGVASGPIKVDRILLDGDTVDAGDVTLTITHTPGHTPGSVFILTEMEGRRIAFSGDSIAGYYSLLNRSSAIDWERSAKKMLGLRIDVLLPGHGDKTHTDQDEIRQILQDSQTDAVFKRKEQAADEPYRGLSDERKGQPQP